MSVFWGIKNHSGPSFLHHEWVTVMISIARLGRTQFAGE